jgi:hypothetical protein
LNRLDKGVPLVKEIEVTATLEVFHEPERIAPVAIRDAEYSAWGAGYASFGKGAVNPHLSAARALGDDLKKGIKEIRKE